MLRALALKRKPIGKMLRTLARRTKQVSEMLRTFAKRRKQFRILFHLRAGSLKLANLAGLACFADGSPPRFQTRGLMVLRFLTFERQ
jgi:hypothetical protein